MNAARGIAAVLAAGLLALSPRLAGTAYFPGKYLWAEDGTVFLNQANAGGLEALLIPYNGYVHVYSRLVSWLASQVDMLHQPAVLLAGWGAAYVILMLAIERAGRHLALRLPTTMALAVLVSLQPHNGENFLNLTNSQWILGTAVFLVVLVPRATASSDGPFHALLLAPLALSGPFSTLALPILAVRAGLLRDWGANRWMYATMLASGVVQVIVLRFTPRSTAPPVDVGLFDWARTAGSMVAFGADTWYELLAVGALWLVIMVSVVTALAQGRRADRHALTSLLLLAAAMLLIAAALYSAKNNPLAIQATGGGNRYTWIPNALIFTAALSLTARFRAARVLAIVLGGFLGLRGFHTSEPSSLQFASFARFSKVMPLEIPIHPQWPMYPMWHVLATPRGASAPVPTIEAPLVAGALTARSGSLAFDATGPSATFDAWGAEGRVVLEAPVACGEASDVGVEIEMTRDVGSWTHLTWATDAAFNDAASLYRWYPAGRVTAHFAFSSRGRPARVMFAPREGAGATTLHRMTFHCMR